MKLERRKKNQEREKRDRQRLRPLTPRPTTPTQLHIPPPHYHPISPLSTLSLYRVRAFTDLLLVTLAQRLDSPAVIPAQRDLTVSSSTGNIRTARLNSQIGIG
jgi:hypothetical protein